MSSLARRARNTPRVATRRDNLYWEPSKSLRGLGFEGQPLGPLSRDALDRADQLNEEADAAIVARRTKQARVAPRPGHRTLDQVFRAYLASREFAAKKPNTQRHYRRHVELLALDMGQEPVAALTAKAIKDWYYPIADVKPRDAFNIFRTLRLVLSWGISENLVDSNAARDVRISTPRPRRRIGTRAELAAILQAADALGRRSIGDYAIAGVTTMQRVDDLLRLRSGHVKAGILSLKQGKTGKAVSFRVHPAFEARFDLTERSAAPLVVSEQTGRAYEYFNFNAWWVKVRDAAAEIEPSIAGLDDTIEDENYRGPLWAQDLRRTGMVWAAQGGARLAGICSISGHEIDHGLNILKVYLPRERLLADQALGTLDIEHEPTAETVGRIAIEGIG